MKKRIIISLLLIFGLFIITGCTKDKEEKNTAGGWESTFEYKSVLIDNDIYDIFKDAKKDYKDYDLSIVALLGEQVVAGKNYMFLAKAYKNGETTPTYKIVIVYNDLENKSSITSVEDFDYTKYTNKDIKNTYEQLSGGWTVDETKTESKIPEDIQKVFDKANNKEYKASVVLGKQVVAGTNYAVLAYGKEKAGIYVLTLYEDLEGNAKIIYSAYVDLADLNK